MRWGLPSSDLNVATCGWRDCHILEVKCEGHFWYCLLLNVILVFLNWNTKVVFWHGLKLNVSLIFLKWDADLVFWHSLRLNTSFAFWCWNAQLMTASIVFCHRIAWLIVGFAFSANNTVFSFCLLMASSTSSWMISNPLGSQELMRTLCKLSLVSLRRSLVARFASATVLVVSLNTGLASLFGDIVASHVGSTGGC